MGLGLLCLSVLRGNESIVYFLYLKYVYARQKLVCRVQDMMKSLLPISDETLADEICSY